MNNHRDHLTKYFSTLCNRLIGVTYVLDEMISIINNVSIYKTTLQEYLSRGYTDLVQTNISVNLRAGEIKRSPSHRHK